MPPQDPFSKGKFACSNPCSPRMSCPDDPVDQVASFCGRWERVVRGLAVQEETNCFLFMSTVAARQWLFVLCTYGMFHATPMEVETPCGLKFGGQAIFSGTTDVNEHR